MLWRRRKGGSGVGGRCVPHCVPHCVPSALTQIVHISASIYTVFHSVIFNSVVVAQSVMSATDTLGHRNVQYVARVGNSLIGFWSIKKSDLIKKNVFFVCFWQFFPFLCLRVNRSHRSFSKSYGSDCQKHTKIRFIRANCLCFERNSLESRANHWFCSFLKKTKVIHSRSLFCKEQREWFIHSHSFVKSNKSYLLKVALF